MTPALVCLTEEGAVLARRIGGEIHGLAGRVSGADVTFTATLAHVAEMFAAGRPIVGFCAAGILIRAVAPLLADKAREPPLVAVSADGSQAVPLLGGHRGANAMAREIAAKLGGTAAVTTAGDGLLGLSLDEPPPGWRIANPATIKPVAAALIAGEGVRVEGEAPWLAGLKRDANAGLSIRVTHLADAGTGERLVYHPPVLALGIGAERGAPEAEVAELAGSAIAGAGLAPTSIACVVSLDLKSDEQAILALADKLGVPARFFDAQTLAREEHRVSQASDVVRAAVGTPSVAEAAALAAAGPDARLIVAKQKSKRATCAIALAPSPIDAHTLGRARGHLDIVGIGPGAADWRTPEASAALRAADDVVGYGLYLDLVAELIAGKPRHETGLGDETGRVERALSLAAEGRRVALVCSGDAGIYALATLAFERMDKGAAEWRRIAVRVAPGISAFQAAAARLGAPLGHDFCAISLSDLLTPVADIERRLAAAAAGDFVVAFYNPASQRRTTLLPRAREILLAARGPEVPVALARNLGRPGEGVRIVRLGDDWAGEVDMLTLVLVGSTATRRLELAGTTRLYTPRGYERKEVK
ncbi:MAG: precorrin-3B C(17)-methyltransferase [Alphaproteobacteria bacterium]|nr:precorrin-3B C(17)-methyltransferase [Alphaproteobacteria bacterium]